MLKLTRREGEALELYLSPEIDPATPIGEVLGSYPITIIVNEISGKKAAIAIDAPQSILVMRNELVDRAEIDSDTL